MKPLYVTIQVKAIEQFFSFHVILFLMLYKVVLTFKFVDEIWHVTIQVKAIEQFFMCYCLL